MSWDNRTADLGSVQKANFWLTVTPEFPHPPGWLHGPQAGGTRVSNHNNTTKNCNLHWHQFPWDSRFAKSLNLYDWMLDACGKSPDTSTPSNFEWKTTWKKDQKRAEHHLFRTPQILQDFERFKIFWRPLGSWEDPWPAGDGGDGVRGMARLEGRLGVSVWLPDLAAGAGGGAGGRGAWNNGPPEEDFAKANQRGIEGLGCWNSWSKQ